MVIPLLSTAPDKAQASTSVLPNTLAKAGSARLAPRGEAETTPFNDTLLNVVNDLLNKQGEEPKSLTVAGVAIQEEENEPLAEPNRVPQQLLDTLLMASQQPVKPVTVSSISAQSGDALLLNQRAAVSVAPPVALLQTTTTDHPPVIKGMQSVTPLPLVTGMGEVTGTTASHGQSTTILTGEKAEAALAPSATLKLVGNQERWAQQLQQALGERLQVQVKDQTQQATIRLEPPSLGKIDIAMQVENGRMQVHINASQGEVYRALMQTSNDLRQSLVEQNFVQVNVQVSSQSGQQKGKEPHSPDPQATILASAEIASDLHQTGNREDESILLTV